MQGGSSGAVIVSGNSEKSRLMSRLRGLGGEPRMPKGSAPLTATEIALIGAWIDQGAGGPEDPAPAAAIGANRHWAYVKPVRPALPAVKRTMWPRNAIDYFVLARLEREGLQPAPEAAKETLLRRVYLDLVGLPPTVEEIDAFLADRSPDAYEKVVDRLLASAHYGERWARA